MPPKRDVASKAKGKKTPTKKAAAKKRAAKATTKETTAKKTTSKTTTKTSSRSAAQVMGSSIRETSGRQGDVIVIDSAQVGSPAREGEILKVVVGEVSVSYRVRWGDGHETLITPSAGTVHIVRT